MGFAVKELIHLFAGDLFLMERTEHECSSAFVLEFGVKEAPAPTYAPKDDVDQLKKRVDALDAFIELLKKFFPFVK